MLDVSLALALLFVDFFPSVKAAHAQKKGRPFDRAAFEAAFDKFMTDQHAQTLGNLRKRLFASALIDDALKAEIDEAKKKRDFIAHHYFRERAVEFAKRTGRDEMIAELDEIANFLEGVTEQIDLVLDKAQSDLGLRPEVMAASAKRFMESVGLDEGDGP